MRSLHRGSGLGPLETKLLELLWTQQRAVTVRHLRLALPARAYTTIMTTLDRLYRKGLVRRRKEGRAFAYEPRCARDELLGELITGQVTDLLGASGESNVVLSTLVRAVSRTDATLLDELDALVQAERRRLQTEDK
ncbi:MAG TPA: BlaI/MecI/CopY family transcriptional regulator [Steroidobacteraceae bacterium]|nr:BlaI/MecI/CopY family transcriptional regulator [Steroidobacteraceae bacterium]